MQIFGILFTGISFKVFVSCLFYRALKTYLKCLQRGNKRGLLMQQTTWKSPDSEVDSLTQEAPEMEAPREATQEATEGDIQEIT